jgi:hypothetical protein
MKTYVLMGKQGDPDPYEVYEFVVGVSRDRSKLEILKAQKESKDAYRKVQWEIYEKCADSYRILEVAFFNQNPVPSYQDKAAYKEYDAKHESFYRSNWEACMCKITAQYGVNRDFMPKETSPEDTTKYVIVEWEEV